MVWQTMETVGTETTDVFECSKAPFRTFVVRTWKRRLNVLGWIEVSRNSEAAHPTEKEQWKLQPIVTDRGGRKLVYFSMMQP